MDRITFKAYAKVNLTLDIVGRRADGYHLLSSIMQSISLADTITLQRKPEDVSIITAHPLVPTNQTNICWRAFDAFRTHTQIRGGVTISIDKVIPVAAGLGGGSADAAAVLYGLNKLFATGLSLEQLQTIGLTVGADVPFCLRGGTCLVQGIGEEITPVTPFPQSTLVLVKPKAGVSTGEIYGQLGSSSHGGTSTQRLLTLLDVHAEPPQLAGVFANALESVTTTLVPEVNVWKKRLLAEGAHQALMSGSGPTVFGLFTHEERALRFKEKFEDETQVFAVKMIDVGLSQMNGGDLS